MRSEYLEEALSSETLFYRKLSLVEIFVDVNKNKKNYLFIEDKVEKKLVGTGSKVFPIS